MHPPVGNTDKVVEAIFQAFQMKLVDSIGIICVLIVLLNILLHHFRGKPAPSMKAPNLLLIILGLFLLWWPTVAWFVGHPLPNTEPSTMFGGFPSINMLIVLIALIPLAVLYNSFFYTVWGSKKYLSLWERLVFTLGLFVFPIALFSAQFMPAAFPVVPKDDEIRIYASQHISIFNHVSLLISLALIGYMTWMLHVRMKLQPSIDEPATGASESGQK